MFLFFGKKIIPFLSAFVLSLLALGVMYGTKAVLPTIRYNEVSVSDIKNNRLKIETPAQEYKEPMYSPKPVEMSLYPGEFEKIRDYIVAKGVKGSKGVYIFDFTDPNGNRLNLYCHTLIAPQRIDAFGFIGKERKEYEDFSYRITPKYGILTLKDDSANKHISEVRFGFANLSRLAKGYD